jgi:hypothetical protein
MSLTLVVLIAGGFIHTDPPFCRKLLFPQRFCVSCSLKITEGKQYLLQVLRFQFT